MALKLYRRHRKECEGGHPEDARTGEFEEGRRGWKKCGCLIHASGTIAGKFNRKQTGKALWEEAKAVAALWETSAWDGAVISLPAADPVKVEQPTIERAIKSYLAEREDTLSYNTLRKNRFVLNALKAYSDSKGYVFLDQWTPIDVREFRQGWGVAHNTGSKYLEIVKAFFEFAVDNEWITRNPARKVKDLKGKVADHRKERVPFSDDELARMFHACENLYGKREVRRKTSEHKLGAFTENYRYKWTGEDLSDFISVSMYTGLRISDVCTFHVDRLLESGECQIRTTKNGKKVYTWIPDWLQARIRERVKKHGPLIFGTHGTQDVNVITDLWRRKLNRLWALCGPWQDKPTPHRFRHTFARILLQRPTVTVRDVAELLGDTEEMIRRHYSAWVPARQERLTAVLKDAFQDKPMPKVVVMTAKRPS